MMNELISYLAGARVTDYGLAPGQPLVYRLQDDERGLATRSVLKTPRNAEVKLDEKDGVVTHRDTRLSGVYVLTTPRNRTIYFVVQPDNRAADDMIAWNENEKNQVAEIFRKGGKEAANPGKAAAVPLAYTEEVAGVLKGPDRDIWWMFLVAVTALLCGEVWMTRRIAKGR
jgi:hypothetical protein